MKIVLHLVRTTPLDDRIAQPVADPDWVVYLPTMRLANHGAPPMPPGPITDDQLVQLLFAADLVVTW